jgi:hypothetical protein
MDVKTSSRKVSVILDLLEWNLEFLAQFFEKFFNFTFYENRPLGAELYHADARTERHEEADSRFSQFYQSA